MTENSHKANPTASLEVRFKRFAFVNAVGLQCGMKLRLKEMRRSRGWTQEQLADLIGAAKSHVSEMETGKKNASAPMLERIAAVFGVQIVELIDAGEATGEVVQLMEIMRQLSPEDRRVVLRSASGLLSQSH